MKYERFKPDVATWEMAKEIFTMSASNFTNCFGINDNEFNQLMDLSADEIADKYFDWCEAGRPKTKMRKGDIVRCRNKYCVLFSYDEDEDTWDMLSSEGRLVCDYAHRVEPAEMHLDLDVVTPNGMITFLEKLEESYARQHDRV